MLPWLATAAARAIPWIARGLNIGKTVLGGITKASNVYNTIKPIVDTAIQSGQQLGGDIGQFSEKIGNVVGNVDKRVRMGQDFAQKVGQGLGSAEQYLQRL